MARSVVINYPWYISMFPWHLLILDLNLVCSIADRFRQYIKYMLLALFTLATGAFTWFALIIEGVAPASYGELKVKLLLPGQ